MKNCIFSCNASASYTGEVTTIYPDEEISDSNEETDYIGGGDGLILDGQGQVKLFFC